MASQKVAAITRQDIIKTARNFKWEHPRLMRSYSRNEKDYETYQFAIHE
jgi:hypothetical protein